MPSSNPLANFGSLSPLRVRALGTVGSPVVVSSPVNKGFGANGREMILDLVRQELSLTPGDMGTSLSQSNRVSVSYDQFNIKGKALYYASAGGNGPGKLDMPGGGTLEGATGTDAGKRFKLEWTDELKVLPDLKDPNLTRIEIRGKPRVELAGMGTVTGDEVLIWCDTSKKTTAGTGPTSTFAAAGGNFDMDLKTILMRRNVVLKTDNGEIQTNELVITFQQPDTVAGMTRSVSRYPGPQLRNQTPATTQAGNNAASGKLSQMSIFGGSDGSKSTFTLQADQVEVFAMAVGKETIVDQIILSKNVRLDEATSVPGQEKMSVWGQTVHITQPDTEQMIVEIKGDNSVSGGHAMFQGRGVTLLGANIHVDREKNRFWVKGPGQLRISQQTVGSAGSRNGNSGFDKLFATSGNTGNQAVIIDWAGSMDFDGRELWFIKDVNVNYSMMAINKSDSIGVRLTRPFRFFETSNTNDIEPEWLEIRGNIDLEHDTFAENNGGQLRHDRIRLSSVEFFPLTGAFKGLGPGSISSIFMDAGDSTSRLLPSGTTAVRTSPSTTNTTTTNATPTGTSGLFGGGLKYMQCNFHHSVAGNYKTGQVTFHDRVVTMLCPAKSFSDVGIDTGNTRNIVANGMLLECSTLEIVQPQQGGNTCIDLKAEGNARIEMTYDNRHYIATAHKIKFEQAKNLITLEGNQYSGVELYVGANLNAPMQKPLVGGRIYFNPVTNETRMEDMRMQSLMP
jgi:lipopolysaccharide export system protein LptA